MEPQRPARPVEIMLTGEAIVREGRRVVVVAPVIARGLVETDGLATLAYAVDGQPCCTIRGKGDLSDRLREIAAALMVAAANAPLAMAALGTALVG